MRATTDIRTVTELKARAADLLDELNETHRPLVITQNGRPRAILQDPETFQQTLAALGMLKLIVQGERDIRQGRTVPHATVEKRIRRRLRT